jgi:hypothetical protein
LERTGQASKLAYISPVTSPAGNANVGNNSLVAPKPTAARPVEPVPQEPKRASFSNVTSPVSTSTTPGGVKASDMLSGFAMGNLLLLDDDDDEVTARINAASKSASAPPTIPASASAAAPIKSTLSAGVASASSDDRDVEDLLNFMSDTLGSSKAASSASSGVAAATSGAVLSPASTNSQSSVATSVDPSAPAPAASKKAGMGKNIQVCEVIAISVGFCLILSLLGDVGILGAVAGKEIIT